MARLKIDIKNKDLTRFKGAINSRYEDGELIELETNEQIVDALTSIIKEYLTGIVHNHEVNVKKQIALSGITVETIDLNE